MSRYMFSWSGFLLMMKSTFSDHPFLINLINLTIYMGSHNIKMSEYAWYHQLLSRNLWPKKSNIPSLYHVKYTSVLEISSYKIIAIFSLKTMLNNILVGQYSCREPQAGLSIEHEIGIFLLTATFCFYIL